MDQSDKYSLNLVDLKSIGRGLLITLGGAALTYLAENVGKVNFGTMTPVVVALLAALINTARKWLQG